MTLHIEWRDKADEIITGVRGVRVESENIYFWFEPTRIRTCYPTDNIVRVEVHEQEETT